MMTRLLWIAGMTLWLATHLSAAPGAGKGPGGGNGMGPKNGSAPQVADATEPRKDSLRQLRQFANLSDEQLIAIRDVINSLLAMSPEERALLKEKIAEFEQLDPDTQVMMRQGWGQLSKEDQDQWRGMMQSLPEPDRQRIHEELRQLPLAERMHYRLDRLEKWKQKQGTNP
jgi:hypothetical protein